MKRIFVASTLLLYSGIYAQADDAFGGRGDSKVQIGANFQRWGTGIQVSVDRGLGESFSVGLQGGYTLGFKEIRPGAKPKTDQRFDLKVRANAHLGDVIGLPQNIDVYPGLDLGLKNFGAHAGMRYFFGRGIGVFAETQVPIARYNKTPNDYQYLHNQYNVTLGAVFDISSF